MTRRSYGASLHRIIISLSVSSFLRRSRMRKGKEGRTTYPETSLTISLTNWVRLLAFPLDLLIRGLTTRASVFYIPQRRIKR